MLRNQVSDKFVYVNGVKETAKYTVVLMLTDQVPYVYLDYDCGVYVLCFAEAIMDASGKTE